MTKRHLISIVLALLVAGSTALAGPGQNQDGSISGTAVDTSGSVIPGTTVVIVSGGARRTAVTATSGRFRFDNLPAGIYRIEATLAGFRRTVIESIVVVAGKDTPVELLMRIGILSIVDCVTPAGGIAGALRRADAALHLRIAMPMRSGLLGESGVMIATEHRADVLDVVKGSDRGVKTGDTLRFWQGAAGEWVEDGRRHFGQHRPYRSGDEIVELLTWDSRDGWTEGYCGLLSMPAVGGFVQLKPFLESPPGIRNGMPVNEFMAALRKLLVP